MGRVELIMFASVEQLAEEVAEAWLDVVEAAWSAGLVHIVGLSGGRIAPKFFNAVVRSAKQRGTRFGHVHFFWADERCVPHSDPLSNFLVAEQHLLGPLDISSAQIHRIRTELGPTDAALEAEAELRRLASASTSGQPVIDLVFLGLGEDGHIASLFPGEPVAVTDLPVVYRAVWGTKLPHLRVTMGYQTLANAKQVWVLVVGAGKAWALRASLNPSGDTPFAKLLTLRSVTRIYAELASVQEMALG